MNRDQTITVVTTKRVVLDKRVVAIGDVASVTAAEKKVAEEVRGYRFCELGEAPERRVSSAAELVALIQNAKPGHAVSVIGPERFLVEYAPDRPQRWEWLKTVLVCFVAFFGGAFSIMTFNQDVEVAKVFDELYRLCGMPAEGRLPMAELGYMLGLPVGILLFYNHFGRRAGRQDPTPLEVQLATYEKEVTDAELGSTKCGQ